MEAENLGVRENLLLQRMVTRDDVIIVTQGPKRRITPYSAEWQYTMYCPRGSKLNPYVIE